MAKLKAHKRRHVRLRRVAVVLLVIVALLVAAGGIVLLHARSIVLAALRIEFPRCDISIGRATLNPLRKLTLYDVEIVDRARPNAPSTVTLDRVVANFAVRKGFKLDVDLDVLRPRVTLSDVTGKTPPFPDLFERKPAEKPGRFRLRQCRIRDCQVKIDDPEFKLETSFEALATGLGQEDSRYSIRDCRVKLDAPNLKLETSFEAAATGLGQAGSPDPASGGAAADITVTMNDLTLTTESTAVVPTADGSPSVSEAKGKTTFRITRLEGTLGYDATRPKMLDRLLLHKVHATDCAVAVNYPGFTLTSTLELGLANDTGDVYGRPTKLAASSPDFQFEAGLLKTYPLDTVIAADLHVQPDASALTAAGTLTAQGLSGTLNALLDKTGLHVTTLFEKQEADRLVDLFESEKPHKIPVIHDFPGLTGTVERFELALSYTPKLGFGLTGAIAADGLQGESDAMMLDVEGISVDTTFSLLPPERGAPLEFVVGDPEAEPGPGRIVAKSVTWNAPGDMNFPAEATGRLWMKDYVRTLGDILGAIFEGKGTGTIQALADGTVTIDLQFDGVNMTPLFKAIAGPQEGQQEDQMTGHADAKLAIVLKSTDAGMALTGIKGTLRTRPPGGLLRLKEKEKSISALPGGQQVAGALKQGMSPRVYDHLLEKLKNYQYESITIEAGTQGDEYIVAIKLRDADKKNPLPVDLTIRYSRVYIHHDVPPPPPQDEGTR